MLRHRHDLQRLNKPRLQVATTVAVATLTVVWFFLGSAAVSAAIERGTLSPAALAFLGGIVSVNFVLLILAALATYRDVGRWGDWFVVVVLAANVIGSVLDQVGLWDAIYLLTSLAVLVMQILLMRSKGRATLTD